MTTRIDIDALVADLKPVRRVRPGRGLALTLLAAAFTAFWVINGYGLRKDILTGMPHGIVIIRAGLLLLLGFATAIAATSSARPSVGRISNGWYWTLAAAALLPVSALCAWMYQQVMAIPFSSSATDFHNAPWCLRLSIQNALLIGGALSLWLRAGAPTAINRAGWLVGLSAGAFGTFSYSLHCPSDSIYYVGIFYTLAVAASAVLGRLIVPHIIRW